MQHVRFNLITADPERLADSVRFIQAEVRPQVDSQPGSLGTSLYTDPKHGLAILESFWASDDAMQASEHTVSTEPPRGGPARGRNSVRGALPGPRLRAGGAAARGAGLRLTRMEFEPSRVEDAVEAYGDTAVPWLADTAGVSAAPCC